MLTEEDNIPEEGTRIEVKNISEKEYTYEVETEVAALNEHNILKPYAYQDLFAKIVEQHLDRLNHNVEITMKHNLAWALMSLSFEIVRPVTGCMKLYANTWFSQRRGPYYRREVLFKNEAGDTIFHGSTFSVLLDLEKRTVYRKKELPFDLTEPTPQFTIDASPSLGVEAEFNLLDKRKVNNSHIDCLGHVNNTRYGEFAYDALTAEECENLSKLERMDIQFVSELRRGDTFSVLRGGDSKQLFIRGHNDIKDTTAFDIILKFRD